MLNGFYPLKCMYAITVLFFRMYVCCNGFILLKCMYAVTVLLFKMYVIMVIRHDQSAFRSLLLRFRASRGEP